MLREGRNHTHKRKREIENVEGKSETATRHTQNSRTEKKRKMYEENMLSCIEEEKSDQIVGLM